MADDIFRKLYRKNQAALTKLQADGEMRIVRIYSDALSGIRKELRKLYRKYQKDGKLSNADKTVYNRLKQLEEHIRDVLQEKNLEIDDLAVFGKAPPLECIGVGIVFLFCRIHCGNRQCRPFFYFC